MFKFIKKIFHRKKEDKIENNNFVLSGNGLDEKILFDFKNYGSMYTGISNTHSIVVSGTNGFSEGSIEEDSVDNRKPTKIAIKPIDVLDQLETIPTPWTLSNLQDKIDVLKYKSELIVQHYAKREVDALIERLENRKKWEDHKAFFNEFQNTTDEKIDNLLDKYDLVMNTSDLFVPEFPDDAIAVMKAYTEEMDKVCGKKPVFYVIAEPDKFKKAYEKRDPILLVQSPFGFYWQILGAWDKEMILLSEL
jgi:hypothetical protein